MGWRCIVLDPYDVSASKGGRGTPPEIQANALLCKMNPNIAQMVQTNVRGDYFAHLPLDSRLRWNPNNGAVGSRQMAWLREELEKASLHGELVVIFLHVLVHPASSDQKTLLWNYEELLTLLQSSAGDVVQIVVSGHQHEGGFYTDERGIHY